MYIDILPIFVVSIVLLTTFLTAKNLFFTKDNILSASVEMLLVIIINTCLGIFMSFHKKLELCIYLPIEHIPLWFIIIAGVILYLVVGTAVSAVISVKIKDFHEPEIFFSIVLWPASILVVLINILLFIPLYKLYNSIVKAIK